MNKKPSRTEHKTDRKTKSISVVDLGGKIQLGRWRCAACNEVNPSNRFVRRRHWSGNKAPIELFMPERKRRTVP